MNMLLFILGVIGLSAIAIAAYVFTVAARDYVSTENNSQGNGGESADSLVERRNIERRRESAVSFPLEIDGVIIPQDRRKQPERRLHTF
jgi:hypothetical protein